MKSLKGKILSSFLVVIGLVLIMGAANYFFTSITNKQTAKVIDEELPLLLIAEKINLNIAERTSLASVYLLFGQMPYYQAFESATLEGDELVEELLALSPSQETNAMVERLYSWEKLMESEVFSVFNSDRDLARDNFRNVGEPLGHLAKEAFNELSDNQVENIMTNGKDVISGGARNTLVNVGIGLATIIFGLAIAIFMANSLSRPIVRVANRMKLIAEGDLTHEDLKTRSKDEVGVLIGAVNDMNRQIRTMAMEIGNVSESVTRQSEELSHSALEVNTGSQQVAITMEELAIASEAQANSTSDLAESMSSFSDKIQDANAHGLKASQVANEVLKVTDNGNVAMTASITNMKMIDENVKRSGWKCAAACRTFQRNI